jgi:hypothetical protein
MYQYPDVRLEELEKTMKEGTFGVVDAFAETRTGYRLS